MTQKIMPRGKAGSPVAALTSPITATSTTIPFDTSGLSDDTPNMITLGNIDEFECIWYITKNGANVVIESVAAGRGFDGTTAKEWPTGTEVARYVSAYDLDAHADNIEDHEDRIATLENAPATHALNDLTDVVITGTPSDKEVVRYDTTTSKFVNEAVTPADIGAAAATHKTNHATGGSDALTAANIGAAAAAHTHNELYLLLAGKAADSELLDGHDTSYFATSGHTHVSSPWNTFVPNAWVSGLSFTVTNSAENQAIFRYGRPICYSQYGSSYYAVVTGYNAGTVTYMGLSLPNHDNTIFAYGDMSHYVVMNLFVPGLYESVSSDTVIATKLNRQITWSMGQAYLVRGRFKTRVVDGGGSACVGAVLGGNQVFQGGEYAVLLNDTAWHENTVSPYIIDYSTSPNDIIEIAVHKGVNGDAQDLSVELGFVLA